MEVPLGVLETPVEALPSVCVEAKKGLDKASRVIHEEFSPSRRREVTLLPGQWKHRWMESRNSQESLVCAVLLQDHATEEGAM